MEQAFTTPFEHMTQEDITLLASDPVNFGLWLAFAGVLSDHPLCENCNTELQFRQTHHNQDHVEYFCSYCGHRESVKQLTPWRLSHLPLVLEIRCLLAFFHRIKPTAFAKEWGISPDPIYQRYKKFRFMMSTFFVQHPITFHHHYHTPDIYEIDECYLTEFSNLPFPLLFGIWNRTSAKLFLAPIPNRQRSTLYAIIQSKIPFGAIICTDEFSSYSTLGDIGYWHYSVNHSQGDYSHSGLLPDQQTSFTVTTNHMESIWPEVKGLLSNYATHLTKNEFQLSIDETMFRHSGHSLFSLFKL